ncbi:hypothetical protein GOBAR_DD16189 [Gossypium barbadense]|nr:hypothetical protein GOBAR_DD16189 [Gossypium barbadense]
MYSSIFQKDSGGFESPVQEKALDALIAFLKAADVDAGRGSFDAEQDSSGRQQGLRRTAYDRCMFKRLHCYRLVTEGVDFGEEKEGHTAFATKEEADTEVAVLNFLLFGSI